MKCLHIDCQSVGCKIDKPFLESITNQIIINDYDIIELGGACYDCDENIILSCISKNLAFNILKELQLHGVRGYRFDCNLINQTSREATILRKYDTRDIYSI